MTVRWPALGVCLLLCPVALAQEPAKPGSAPAAQPQFPPLTGEELKLDDKEIPTPAELRKAQRFATSNDPEARPQGDADRAIIEKVVRYYLYRLTWDSVIFARDPQRVGTIPGIMLDILGSPDNFPAPKMFPQLRTTAPADQDEAATRARQRAYVQMLTPIILQNARQVLQSREISARINVTRVLNRLAEWGREEVVDDLVRIIANPQESDAVRVHAFQGLEEILALRDTNDPRAQGLFAGKGGPERFNQALATILDWLDARTKVNETVLQFMKQEEMAAIRYVRRAAERALGAGKRPLIVDVPAENKRIGPIADLLTRIANNDGGIAPSPDIRERLEACLAVCQLRSSFSPSYQADYAAGVISRFLVDLGALANDDKERKYINWPLEADRLKRNMDAFAAQTGMSNAIATYVKAMVGAAKPLLEYFDDAQKNTTAVQAFNNWIQSNPPASKEVYKPLGQK